jgi:hypothetical protein
MKLFDSDFTKAKIVINHLEDEIVNCRLVDCEIVSRVNKILFKTNHITTNKPILYVGRNEREQTPIIHDCVLLNCKLPKNCCLESNYIEYTGTE